MTLTRLYTTALAQLYIALGTLSTSPVLSFKNKKSNNVANEALTQLICVAIAERRTKQKQDTRKLTVLFMKI